MIPLTPEEILVDELCIAQERLDALANKFEEAAHVSYDDVTHTRENLLYWLRNGGTHESGLSRLTPPQRRALGLKT